MVYRDVEDVQNVGARRISALKTVGINLKKHAVVRWVFNWEKQLLIFPYKTTLSLTVCEVNQVVLLNNSFLPHACISTSLLMIHSVTWSCWLCCHLAFVKDSARVETSASSYFVHLYHQSIWLVCKIFYCEKNITKKTWEGKKGINK